MTDTNFKRGPIVAMLARLMLVAGLYLLQSAYDDKAHARITTDQIQHEQQTLISLGYNVGAADGTYGPKTRAAVKAFQASKGLRQTGTFNSQTLQALGASRPVTPPATAAIRLAPKLPATTTDSNDDGAIVVLILAGLGYLFWLALRVNRRPKPGSSRTAVSPTPHVQVSSRSNQVPMTSGKLRFSGHTITSTAADGTNQTAGCWVPANRPVTVAGHTIPSGLVYVGTALPTSGGYGAENCLINPTLEVSRSAANDGGLNVPYWPSYTHLDPSSRLSLLNWLAGGKGDPSIYIGFVVIYFYGLERRLILEDAGTEAPVIIGEVRRLLALFQDNHSFVRYASELIGAAAFKYTLPVSWPAPSLRKTSWQLPLELRVCLGQAIAAGQPLTAEQSLAWYGAHPDKKLLPLAARCPDEFLALYALKFARQYPSGLTVTVPKRTLKAEYRAASSTFTVQVSNKGAPIPDVAGITAPLNAIEPLIAACTEELASYARIARKDSTEKNALAAAIALPTELVNLPKARPLVELKSWLDQQVGSTPKLFPTHDLQARLGVNLAGQHRAGKADMNLLAVALERCGYGLEPDPAINYPTTGFPTDVVVFTCMSARPATVRPQFMAALAYADIGMLVATSAGGVSPDELDTLRRQVVDNQDLLEPERARLMARFVLLARHPPALRILKLFKDRSASDREVVARLAVMVATAGGRQGPEEVRLLEKIYGALALPLPKLYSQLQSLGFADEPLPTVAPADTIKSSPIPTRLTAGGGAIALDRERLARTRADTVAVSSILGEIFADADEAAAGPTVQPAVEGGAGAALASPPVFTGLDPKYVAVLQEVIDHGPMARKEFEELVSARHLMCEGVIEAVNDWAFDILGDLLIEDGDPIIVNANLLQQKHQAAE